MYSLLQEQSLLAVICGNMSRVGIRLDRERLAVNLEKLKSDKLEVAQGFSININSHKQLKAYFLEKHNITLPDTQKETIHRLSEQHREIPELDAVYRYKDFGKGMEAWFAEELIDANNYLHPRWNPTGTSERRLSCANPNFQNVPHRNESFAELMRSVIIPEDDCVLYEVDASSGEDWTCAFAANDERLLEELSSGIDFHSRTAGLLYEVAVSKKLAKSDHQQYLWRDGGKRVNHMHKYGQGFKYIRKGTPEVRKMKAQVENGLALLGWEGSDYYAFFNGYRMAEIAYGQATYENQKRVLKTKAQLIKDYKGIIKWQQDVFETWRKTNYIRNPYGFGRPFYGDEEECFKRALAFVGASTLQTIVIRGMIDIDRTNMVNRPGTDVQHAQIHDSLLFSLRDEKVTKDIVEIMQRPREGVDGRKLSVPWEGKSGSRWSEL